MLEHFNQALFEETCLEELRDCRSVRYFFPEDDVCDVTVLVGQRGMSVFDLAGAALEITRSTGIDTIIYDDVFTPTGEVFVVKEATDAL